MIIDTYDDEHLRLETQQIWGYERKMHFFFIKKKKYFLKKSTKKEKRKSRQNLCVINCIVWWLARIVPHSWFCLKKMIWLIAWSWVLRGCCHVGLVCRVPQAPSQCLGSYLLALSHLCIAVLLDGIKGKGYGFKYLITFSQLYGIQK